MNKNEIQVIQPYRHAGTWVFDDAAKGLDKEPFVCGIPAIIDAVVRGIPDSHRGFRLLFSAKPFPGSMVKLAWRRVENGGNWYWSEQHQHEGWLCPALFRYFDIAPPELYAKAEPVR